VAQPESGLLIATESITFEHRGQPVFLHPGSVIRTGNPIIRGREQFFTPLVIVADFDNGPLSPVPVAVVGQDGDSGFSWVRIKVRGTFSTADTPSLFNLGG
jgi:hypothetical protein